MGELTNIFSKETPRLIAELRKLTAEGNFKATSLVAHRIRSSSASIGANRLYDVCEWIEKTQTPENIPLMIDALEHEYQLAIKELQERSFHA